MTFIHPTSCIDKTAEIDEDVYVGPYCYIGPNIKISSGCKLLGFVVLEKNVFIGFNNIFYYNNVIGAPPQDIKFKGEESFVKIGNRNLFREFTTVHRATGEGESTIIGDNNYFMAYVHIAHNVKIGNNVIIANSTQLSGHVEIEDYAFISGLVGIHQFTRIGAYAMVGGLSAVVRDVLPYSLVSGMPARFCGLNYVGLRRRNFDNEKIDLLKRAFKILYSQEYTLKEALNIIEMEFKLVPEIDHLIQFIRNSKRGIIRKIYKDESGEVFL